MATPSTASSELASIFDEYSEQMDKMEAASKEAGVTAAEEAGILHPLWGDPAAANPYESCLTYPSNCKKTMLISELLCNMLQTKSLPEELPGYDFEVAVYEKSDWPEEAQVLIPDSDDVEIRNYVPPIDRVYWFMYSITTNQPVYLTGERGSGKSTLPKYCAAMINHPLLRKPCTADLTTDDFFGAPGVKQGETVFVEGDAPETAKLGAWMLMDEVSNMPSELHPGLHYMLEQGGKIYLNSSDENIASRIIVPKDSFRIIASDNTRGQGDTKGKYAGTNVLNSAFMDRFTTMIVIDYVDAKTELKILKKAVPDITDKLARLMIKTAAQIREGYKTGELSETMSIRPMLEWAKKCLLTHNVTVALEMTFLNKIDSESERTEIKSYLQANFGSLLNK